MYGSLNLTPEAILLFYVRTCVVHTDREDTLGRERKWNGRGLHCNSNILFKKTLNKTLSEHDKMLTSVILAIAGPFYFLEFFIIKIQKLKPDHYQTIRKHIM